MFATNVCVVCDLLCDVVCVALPFVCACALFCVCNVYVLIQAVFVCVFVSSCAMLCCDSCGVFCLC